MIGFDNFNSFTTRHRKNIRSLFNIPYLHLLIIWTTNTFLPWTCPTNRIDFTTMSQKRMHVFSGWCTEYTYAFISGASQQSLSSIIQSNTYVYALCRIWVYCSYCSHAINILHFDCPVSSATCKQITIVIESKIIYFTLMMFYQFFQRLSQNLIIYVFGTFLLLLFFLFPIGVIKGNLFFLHPKDLTSGGFWLLFLRLFFLLHFLELFPLFLNIKLLSFDLFLFLMKTDL